MLSLVSLALLATSSLVHATPLLPRDTSTVDLGYAKYKGTLDTTTNVTNFLGVRFAAAPVGDLRWKAPQAPPTVADVQDASTEPNQCHQAPAGTAASSPWRPYSARGLEARESAEDEDCLFLNVHVPGNVDASKKLPVVVWIHGGGYLFDSASAFDGGKLVQDSGNQVVTVVIQYRLGLFGFLAGAKVKEGGVLNAGLLDQEFALKWVQEHIAQFGGDASQVTIWGQSAGGGSVLQQMVARGGASSPALFRAGIASSPFLPPQYSYDDFIPESLYTQVLNQTNCADSDDGLACLRAADVSTLAAANAAINGAGFSFTFTFVPVVDGEFITQRVTQSLKEKRVNAPNLLSVHNTHEGLLFVNPNTTYSAGDYAKQVYPKLTDDQASQVDAAYASFETAQDKAVAVMGESIIICPSYYAESSFEGFKGHFDISPADHLQDLSYYFTDVVFNPSLPPVFKEGGFQTTFAESFLSFAMSLDPNNKISSNSVLPSWPKYTCDKPVEMYFGKTDDDKADIKAADSDAELLKRCALWDSFTGNTSQ